MIRLIYKLACLGLILISINGFSQDVLLEEEWKAEESDDHIGPNDRHFGLFHIHVGHSGVNDHVTTLSPSFSIGGDYRYQIVPFFGIGVHGNLGVSRYRYADDSIDGFVVEKLRTQTAKAWGGPFVRISLGKRGDYLGNYVDAGLVYEWNFRNKTKYNIESINADEARITLINPSDINKWISGYYIAINRGWFGVYGVYRSESFTTMFDSSPYEFGVRFGF
jgi:hypothetical protein